MQTTGIIYKYVSVDSALKIIGNDSFRLTPPVYLNDPFDCNLDIIDFDFDRSYAKSLTNSR